MPSIYTHGIVGLGLGKAFTGRRLPILFWIMAFTLPIIPDFDVFSDISYGNIAGHRGFTHSLCFALAVGLVALACAVVADSMPTSGRTVDWARRAAGPIDRPPASDARSRRRRVIR